MKSKRRGYWPIMEEAAFLTGERGAPAHLRKINAGHHRHRNSLLKNNVSINEVQAFNHACSSIDSNEGRRSGFWAKHRWIKFFNSADKCGFNASLYPVISSSFSNGKLPQTCEEKLEALSRETNRHASITHHIVEQDTQCPDGRAHTGVTLLDDVFRRFVLFGPVKIGIVRCGGFVDSTSTEVNQHKRFSVEVHQDIFTFQITMDHALATMQKERR